MERDAQTQLWLAECLARCGAVAGTVHIANPEGELLELAAAVNIPPKVQQITSNVPRGKGMAGLALERREPVSTCDLQTDASGDVRPGARSVEAQAAVALPVFDGEGRVRAVVGIAFAEARSLSTEELTALGEAASSLPLG